MGFLKSFFGKAIAGLGNLFGSEKMINFGNKLQGKNVEEIIDEAGDDGPFDPATASIRQVEQQNKYLADMREAYMESAESIEKACWAYVSSQYDDLIKLAENTPEIFADSSAAKELKKEKNKAKKKISGSIKDPIARRFSLDDWECRSIAEMDSGNNKKSKFKSFNKKVVREALDDLSLTVKEELQSQINSLHSILNDVCEKKERSLNDMKTYFDTVSEEDHIDQITLEYSCVKPVLVYDSADMVLEIL